MNSDSAPIHFSICSSLIAMTFRYVDELLYWSGRRMLLDEYLQGELSPNRLPPTWVSRTKFVFQSDDGNLAVYETTNNTVKTLVTNYTLVSSTQIDSMRCAAAHTKFMITE